MIRCCNSEIALRFCRVVLRKSVIMPSQSTDRWHDPIGGRAGALACVRRGSAIQDPRVKLDPRGIRLKRFTAFLTGWIFSALPRSIHVAANALRPTGIVAQALGTAACFSGASSIQYAGNRRHFATHRQALILRGGPHRFRTTLSHHPKRRAVRTHVIAPWQTDTESWCY